MNRRYQFLLVLLTLVIVAGAVTLAVWQGSQTPGTCRADQPVYAGTVNVGTWQVALQPGQSVPLPDGDTLTCTAHGTEVH